MLLTKYKGGCVLIKQKDFRIFHLIIIIFYLGAFINGVTGKYIFSVKGCHPFIGLGVIIVPGIYFLVNSNKKIIKNFIKGNYKLSGKRSLVIAKLTTVLIMINIDIMIITGIPMYLYILPDYYMIFYIIHRAVLYVLPVLVFAHIVSRKISKKKQ